MGACFDCRVYDGGLTKQDVQAMFNSMQESLRNEYGYDAYNGTFSNCYSDIRFFPRLFESVDEAYDYLADSLDKRDVAAVRAKEDGKEVWVVGGWCPE